MGILLTTAGSDNKFGTQCIHAMFEMFFSSINANFIEHIAFTNTDNLKEIYIDELKIANIIKNIN